MGRNEIRLRRQKMSSGRIAQHRNYGELMERHVRNIRLRRIVKTFIYFLIIVALLIMFVIVSRWERKKVETKPDTALVTGNRLKDIRTLDNEEKWTPVT